MERIPPVGHKVERDYDRTIPQPKEPAKNSHDAYFAVVLLSGSYLLEQNGREAILTPGDVTIYDATIISPGPPGERSQHPGQKCSARGAPEEAESRSVVSPSLLPRSLPKTAVTVSATFLLVAFALASGLPAAIDLPVRDALLRALPSRAPDGVAVVAIDETSLDAVGPWPWPRARIAEVVDAARAAGARGLAIDLLLAEPAAGDDILAASLRRLPSILAAALDARTGWVDPAPALAAASRPPRPLSTSTTTGSSGDSARPSSGKACPGRRSPSRRQGSRRAARVRCRSERSWSRISDAVPATCRSSGQPRSSPGRPPGSGAASSSSASPRPGWETGTSRPARGPELPSRESSFTRRPRPASWEGDSWGYF